MRQKKDYCIMTFATTEDALAMEEFCRQQDIPGRIIPLPGDVAAGCGLCWRMSPEEARQWKPALQKQKIQGVYTIQMWG